MVKATSPPVTALCLAARSKPPCRSAAACRHPSAARSHRLVHGPQGRPRPDADPAPGWWSARIGHIELQAFSDDDVHVALEGLAQQRSRYYVGDDVDGRPIFRDKRKPIAPATSQQVWRQHRRGPDVGDQAPHSAQGPHPPLSKRRAGSREREEPLLVRRCFFRTNPLLACCWRAAGPGWGGRGPRASANLAPRRGMRAPHRRG